jgi:hypothetical protein
LSIFMQQTGIVKRLSMEVRPAAVAAVRQSSTANRVTPTKAMGILSYPCGRVSSLKCQVSSKRGRGPGSSKSEARNPKQIQMANDTNGGKQGEMRGFGTFEFRSLELVSNFEIRASNLAPGAGDGRRRPNAQNEPNFPRPQAAEGENRAKRSQTWGAWSIWEKAVAVRGVGRLGVKRAKRSQFLRSAGARTVKCAKRTQFGPAGE